MLHDMGNDASIRRRGRSSRSLDQISISQQAFSQRGFESLGAKAS